MVIHGHRRGGKLSTPIVLVLGAALGSALLLATLGTGLAGVGRAAAPLSTATYTPTPSDPEYRILQYVVLNNNYYCQGPYGSPGHRYIANCYPFMYGSHPTTGYADGFGDITSAQTEWQTRRTTAQNTYPIFVNTTYGGYPAFDAGNETYPFAHYESYFWANVWVMGAVSNDDTQYRGSPVIANAIVNAAYALGYLPGGIPTVTSTSTGGPTYTNTPTNTSTSTPTNTSTPTPTGSPPATPTCGLDRNYIITQSTGATMVPGTDLVPGSQADDAVVSIVLPFTYYLYGQRFTGVRADTNGNLQFSGGASDSLNQCLPEFSHSNFVMPLWDDLTTAGEPSYGIYTSLQGIAPLRRFTIEWRAALVTGGEVNFEARLYEEQNRFDFIYGNVMGGGAGATIGVMSMLGWSYTQFSCNTASLQPGLQLAFVQGNCSNYAPMLIGHVTWQGPPAQPHSRQQLPITLTLRSAVIEAEYPAFTTDASGFFTAVVGSLPDATYTYRVKGPKYLANGGSVLLTGNLYTQAEMGLMRAGDCNDSNVVDAADFNILRATFNKSLGDPGYDPRADFNGDNQISALDFNWLRTNYGDAGAPPILRP